MSQADPDGRTFAPTLDRERLRTQLERVREFLRANRGRYLTTLEISDAMFRWQTSGTFAIPSGIAARIRDLRKPEFGAFTIHARRRGDRTRGVWEYAMTGEEGSGTPHRVRCPECGAEIARKARGV